MKNLLKMALLLSVIPICANAGTLKTYRAAGKDPRLCKVVTRQGGKWVTTTQNFEGQQVDTKLSSADPKMTMFESGGIIYAARTACFSEGSEATAATAASGNSAEPSASAATTGKKFFIEAKARKYWMIGAGMGGDTATTSGTTITTSPYTTNLGFAGRIGYNLDSDKALFLDVSTLSGTQSGVYTGAVTGNAIQDETLVSVNLGYMRRYGESGFVPYTAFSLGYTKMNGSFAGTLSSTGAIATTYNASALNLNLELGATYSVTSMLDLVGSVDYTFLKISDETVEASNNPTTFPVGSKVANSLGYGHLGFALGLRASF